MSFFSEAINTILPKTCMLCNRDVPYGKSVMCVKCMSQIVPLQSDRRWFMCLSEPYKGDIYPELRLYMPFTYNEFWNRYIHSIKFKKHQELASIIGSFMGDLLRSDGVTSNNFDLIIPIPLSSARQQERGFNQALEIATPIGEKLNIPVITGVVVRTKDTLRQSDLSDNSERSINITDAFSINEEWDVQGLRILLIDDVATTGQTLHEAATVLKLAGAHTVLCVAVCGNRSIKNLETY